MQQIDFTRYHYLIMDSSFFVSPLDDALCGELSRFCDPGRMPFLCASSTFHSECRQYAQLLEHQPDQLQVYQDNLEKLRSHNIRLYINQYTAYNNENRTPRHDTWNLINCLLEDNAGRSPGILLLTGNELLLRRVVLSGLPVSIYDLKLQKVFTPEQLAQMKPQYELDAHRDPIQLQIKANFKPNDTLTLFTAEGDSVKLIYDLYDPDSSVVYEGTEGHFFSVADDPSLVAKVYGKDVRTSFCSQIAQNIEDMKHFHDTGRFPWAVFPESLLYDSAGSLAGYLMRKVGQDIPRIQEDSRFNVSDDQADHRDKPYSETLQICLTILREIAYMSNYDILPVDFGKGNFCANSEVPYVYMLDTCSFCFNRFFSAKHDSGLIPKYADADAAAGSKLALVDLFQELVHLFIMSMMTLGCDIFVNEETGVMSFMEKKPEQPCPFDCLVPQNLHQLYKSLFPNKKEPEVPFSIEVLMEEMECALEVVRQEEPTYGSLAADGRHKGSVYADPLPEVLPCTYGEIIVIAAPGPEKKEPAKQDCPGYLRHKEPPAVHGSVHCGAAAPRCSRYGRAMVDPLPPVYQSGGKSYRGLFLCLGVLLAVMLLLGLDMLRFSGESLGFTPALYWHERMESIKTFWTDAWQGLFAWFGSMTASFRR